VTPGCTVCGYAVEVVRSCFCSQWRLFRNSTVTTPGQYIYAGENAECYPGWHLLGSRDWTTDDWPKGPLGEVRDAQRTYALGAALGPVPLPDLIGTADCIRNGETWPLAVPVVLNGGFDQRCPQLVPAPQFPLAVANRSNWCFWAQIIVQVYTDSPGAMDRVADAMGTVPNGYSQRVPVGIVPAYFILNSPPDLPIVVVIAGTDNAVQWITQIFYGARPPDSYASFATNRIWYSVASTLLERMLEIAVSPTQEIIIVGHSLGAAAACVLAARLRLGQPGRSIQLLTLGCPRPGNTALIDLLRTMTTVSLQDEGDVVTGIPSNLYDIPPAYRPIVAAAYPAGSPIWVAAPNRYRIAWDGTVTEGAADPGVGPALQAIVDWGIGGGAFPDLSQHLQTEYQRRLCIPAPAPIAWLDAWTVQRAPLTEVPVWTNVAIATNSPDSTLTASIPPWFLSRSALLACVDYGITPDGQQVQEFPTGLAGTPAWAWYAVLAPDISIPLDIEGRYGVPLAGAPGGPGAPLAEFFGSATSNPGWTVTFGTATATIPWTGRNVGPTLVSASWDGSTLSIRLENSTVGVAVASGVGTAATWDYVGGVAGAPQPTPFAQVSIGEVLFYDTPLSTDQDTSILDYLRIKWLVVGLAIAAESGDLLLTEGGDLLVTE
jgi:Lipase (class 3)